MGKDNENFAISRYTLLYEIDKQQGPTVFSTGNYIRYLVITYNEKESEKEYIYIYICIYITESLCIHPKLTHCNAAMSIKN